MIPRAIPCRRLATATKSAVNTLPARKESYVKSMLPRSTVSRRHTTSSLTAVLDDKTGESIGVLQSPPPFWMNYKTALLSQPPASICETTPAGVSNFTKRPAFAAETRQSSETCKALSESPVFVLGRINKV